MELILKDINVCEYNNITNTNCSAEADIIVPDTKPDIYKILCVNAVANMSEHYIRKGKIVFSGNVKFNILYVGDNNKSQIYAIEYTVPFNHQSDMSEALDDCTCMARCQVSSTDFKLKNSRKMLAKCNLAFTAQAMKHNAVKSLEKVDGEADIPFKQKSIKADSLVVSNEFSFNVSDTMSLPVKDEGVDIYDFTATINISEIKTVNNKAIIKGTLPAKIFYANAGSLGTYETELPFTEIADLDMVSTNSILSSDFVVSNIDYEVSEGSEEVTLDVDILVNSCVKAYEPQEYYVTSDIYSPDYTYSISKSKSDLERFTRLNPTQITVKDIIGSKGTDGDIAKVHYINVYPSCEKYVFENSNLMVSGNVNTTVIYSNHDDELCSIQKSIPYSAEIPSNENLENSFFNVVVMPVNYGYVLSSDKDIQVRIVLRFEADAYTTCSTNLITDFSVDKNSPLDKSSQPGITVCYHHEGVSLWDYAREYNTTVEEIAVVNKLDDEAKISAGSPILIPKRMVN